MNNIKIKITRDIIKEIKPVSEIPYSIANNYLKSLKKVKTKNERNRLFK